MIKDIVVLTQSDQDVEKSTSYVTFIRNSKIIFFSHNLYLFGLLVLAIPSDLFLQQIFVLNFKCWITKKINIFIKG